MKRIILLLLAGGCIMQLHSQGHVQITNGAFIKTTGNACIVLNNMSLINDGDLQQARGNGKLLFTGNSEAHLLGSSTTTTIDNLWLSKAGNSKLNLLSNISVMSGINFGGGLLNMENSVVDLGSSGILIGESENSRAYTTGTGYLQAVADLNAPQAANPGNLGATITSRANMGSTIVRRGHAVQSGINGTGTSIQRYFEIIPTNNTALNATLRLGYFDAELNGINENSLSIWKNTGSWILLGANSQDLVTNYVEKTNVQNFSRVTLAQGCPVIPVTIPDVFAVTPGGAANTIYTGYGPSSLTLTAQVSGGTGPYTYRWTAGAPGGTVVGSGSTLTVSPTATTTYYLNVTDAAGCNSDAVTKTIAVTDVRCGAKLDKVTVCILQKGKYTTSCVTANSMANYLANGGNLGACPIVQPVTTRSNEPAENTRLTVSALPNPASHYFTLVTRSGREEALSIRVVDILGRVLEHKTSVPANSSLQLGHHYRPGIYFVEVLQGKEKITAKLVKRI